MALCDTGSTCITINKRDETKYETDITPKPSFDLARALESCHYLLERVFSYLNYNDLQSVSKVKRSWHLMARSILEHRNQINWMTVVRNDPNQKHSTAHFSDNYGFCKVQIAIVLFNRGTISSKDLFHCHNTISSSDKPEMMTLHDFLVKEVAPRGTRCCTLSCPNVSSLFSKNISNEYGGSIFDVCLIPEIPNVKVSVFYCNPSKMRDDYIERGYKLRALLLFCQSDLRNRIYTIFQNLIPGQNWKFCAVGGGLISKSTIFPQSALEKHEYKSRGFSNLCITFAERDPSHDHEHSMFSASSVVIGGNDLSAEEFEKQLLSFKKKILLRTHNFAFRICCAAKANKGLESQIFNKLFPNTPLMGLEANGEYGWNCLNPERLERQKTKNGYPVVKHQWSTVFVLISWGRLAIMV